MPNKFFKALKGAKTVAKFTLAGAAVGGGTTLGWFIYLSTEDDKNFTNICPDSNTTETADEIRSNMTTFALWSSFIAGATAGFVLGVRHACTDSSEQDGERQRLTMQ